MLQYLERNADVVAFALGHHAPSALSTIAITQAPPWPAPYDIFIWLRSAGPLVWHTERPRVEGETHGQLVNRLFASEAWDQHPPDDHRAMLDVDASPVVVYRRSLTLDGQVGPCALFSPATNAANVAPAFEKWVRRILSWVRRKSTRIHDWRHQCSELPNPHGIVSSLYAFPKALARIRSGDHDYAILLR